MSQIGVLLWLKEQGIEIYCISGTSIGAILGAAVAVGYSPEYLKEEASKINRIDLLKYMRLSFSGKSVFDWDKIEGFLKDKFSNKSIEDLRIPFACVASDIDSGQEFIFSRGDLVAAVSASSCIPGIFPPVNIHQRHLIDGELVNPVPLDIALELGADLVIGVNTCRSVFAERMQNRPDHPSLVKKMDGWVRESLGKTPLRYFHADSKSSPGDNGQERPRSRNIIDVITDSIAIVSSRVLAFERLRSGPHFIIRPPVGAYQDFDFDRAREIIDLGYAEAEKEKDELFRFLGT